MRENWKTKSLGAIITDSVHDWYSSLHNPDPWSGEVDAAVRAPDAVPVCHRCITPCDLPVWFCPSCGAAFGPYNNIMPFVYIFSMGEVVRSGVGPDARFTRFRTVGYAVLGLAQYGVFAPLYYLRLFLNYRHLRKPHRDVPSQEGDHRLWYRQPATVFEEALPVGNGSIGAMVYGGVGQERISLNHDQLWSGFPEDKTVPGAHAGFLRARELLDEGRVGAAERVLWQEVLSTWATAYQPAGHLELRMPGIGDPVDYRRELDLATALATTRFSCGGVRYTREVFCSYPDQVLVVTIACDEGGKLDMDVRLHAPHPARRHAGEGTLVLKGLCPVYSAPDYFECEDPVRYDPWEQNRALTYAIAVRPVFRNGSVRIDDDRMAIRGADSVSLLITLATNFEGCDKAPSASRMDPVDQCGQRLAAAEAKGLEAIWAAHIADHGRLYHRVDFHLEGSERRDLPTDERIAAYAGDHSDVGLVKQLFDVGRYLMIASSRPGSEPANLQGLWNEEVRPPWSCNYTLNINAQMNYWPAEVCHLPECHEPLIALIRDLARKGRKTAKIHYGCRGWCAHHNTDVWRQTEAVGREASHAGIVGCGFWMMGGTWLARHVWEHYAYSMDREFLARHWEVLKGAALFMLDLLVEDENGHLHTSPSNSPENWYRVDGEAHTLCRGSTMDLALARDIFAIVLEAGQVLEVDGDFLQEVSSALGRLRPYQVGARGQLLEWDREYEEVEPQHRHFSHLYGLHPGASITVDRPDWMAAVRRSLELRGDDSTGWSLGWKVNQWARLFDGDRALALLHMLLRLVRGTAINYTDGGGVYPNLLDAGPPFQIDGNFAVTAGIAEMLLQSHDGQLRLLPALPRDWAGGRVRGLRARGGYGVDLVWREHRLSHAVIHAQRAGVCRVRYGETVVDVPMKEGATCRLTADLQPCP